SATEAPPLIFQVWPPSDEITSRAFFSSIFHMETGRTHSPVDKTIGLHIITPSVSRFGAPQFGSLISGSSISNTQTPDTVPSVTRDQVPPLFAVACAQNTLILPSGPIQTSGSKALTGPSPSGSISNTSSQFSPRSELVATTT